MGKAATKAGGDGASEHCKRAAGALSARLARVEGQVRALRRMIEEGQPCEEMATQLAAAAAAMRRAAFAFFAYRMQECIKGRGEQGESLDRLGELFMRLG